jgi:AhpD family alkylhydroperoxidase
MATIGYLRDSEAEGKTKEVYEDIKRTYGCSEPHKVYELMGYVPEYLAASWERSKLCFKDEGELGIKLKHIITLAVSATNNCDYCVNIHTARLKELGMTDKQIVELMMVVDLVNGYNRFVQGLQADPETKPFGPDGLIHRKAGAR